ncbi:carbohydrate ABC transporter permease [Paenibacillus sp. GCM10027628]|uniref:carbohydrate ABC transporter permease n=1 Tax=Paenibacillus sp. GCM10027628 TaxID=3273413 RepID=UPI00362547A6
MKQVHAIVFTIILILALVVLFPLYVALLMSLKTSQETFLSFYSLPGGVNLGNYIHAWNTSHYPVALLNSFIITTGSVLLIIAVSSLAGYSIARRKSIFYQLIFLLFLAGIMVPFQVTMLPLYRLGKMLNLINTHWGIMLIYGGAGVQTGVFFYAGFIKAISRELEEAAKIDGCSVPGIFFRIIFPLLKPVTATVMVLNTLYIWNDFLLPLLFLQKDKFRTIPLQQYYFFGQYSSDLNLAFAYAVMGMIPIIAFFLLMQKFIVKGITAGAIKG